MAKTPVQKALVGNYTNTDVRPEVFGLNATPSNVIKYGSLTAGTPVPTTDLKEIIDNDAYRLGLEGGSQTIVDPVSGDMYSAPSLQELGSAMIASSLHNLSNWRRSYHDYDATFTYETNDQTLGSDNKPYQSLQNNNIGHDPVTSPAWWGAIKAEADSVGLLSSGLSKLGVPLTITADLTANTISVSAIDDIYFVKDGDITKISVPAKVFTVNQANIATPPLHPNCIAYYYLYYDKTGSFVALRAKGLIADDFVLLCAFTVQYNAGVPTFLPASKVANPITIFPYLSFTPWTQKANRNQLSEVSIGIVGGGLALQMFESNIAWEGLGFNYWQLLTSPNGDPSLASILPVQSANPLKFRYTDPRMATSVNGFSDLVTAVDPTKYYNGTDVAAVPAGKFTIQTVILSPRVEVEVIYNTGLFDDIESAILGANNIVMPDISDSGSIFLGVLVLAQDCTDLGDTSKAQFIRASGANGGSSASSDGGTTPVNNGAVYIPVYEKFRSTQSGSNIYGFGGITQFSINSSSVVNIITFQSDIAIPSVTDSSTHFAQFPPVPLASATPIQLRAVAAYIDSPGVNTTQSTKAIRVEYNMNTGTVSLYTGKLSDYRGYIIYVNSTFSTAIPGTNP